MIIGLGLGRQKATGVQEPCVGRSIGHLGTHGGAELPRLNGKTFKNGKAIGQIRLLKGEILGARIASIAHHRNGD